MRRRFPGDRTAAEGTDTDPIRVKVKMHPYTAHCVKKGMATPSETNKTHKRNSGYTGWSGEEMERRVRKTWYEKRS